MLRSVVHGRVIVRAVCALLGAVTCSVATPARAQVSAQPADSACYYSDRPGRVLRFSLPGSYRLELRRDANDRGSEHVCAAAVYNSRDSLVWGARGFGAALEEWTGHDIDGDGNDDAVLMIDTGGGNHCCRSYFVLTLVPRFAVVATLNNPTWFALDDSSRTVIWEIVAFYALGRGSADAPTVLLPSQIRGGKLVSIAAELCTRMLTDTTMSPGSRSLTWRDATAPRRAASKRALAADSSYDVEQTRAAVRSLAMQYLACDRETDARKLVDESWPAAEASKVFETLRAAWAGAAKRSGNETRAPQTPETAGQSDAG